MPQDNKLLRLGLRTFLFSQVATSKDLFIPENRRTTEIKSSAPVAGIVETFVPSTEALVATGTHEGLGRVQYDVLAPKGRGTSDAEDMATLIQTAFRPPLVNVTLSDGSSLCIDRAERFPARDWDETFFAFSVSIRWRYYS